MHPSNDEFIDWVRIQLYHSYKLVLRSYMQRHALGKAKTEPG